MAENISKRLPIGTIQQLDLSQGSDKYNLNVDFDIDKFFNAYTSGPQDRSYETYSPVVHKVLGAEQQNNIEITGQFRTDFVPDASNINSGYSYITVRNNSIGKAIAHGGYGIAWKPSSSDNDTKTTVGNYALSTKILTIGSSSGFDLASNSSGIAYVDNIPFTYTGVGTNTLTGVTVSLSAGIAMVSGAVVTASAHNILIVDNDYVGADIYAGRYKEFDGGALSFIASSYANIQPDTIYYFSLIIGTENEIQFRISSDESTLDGSDAVITSGARTNLSKYLDTDNMDAFSLSVVDTRGYKWYYDNIKIGSLDSEYPVAYFEMDTTNLSALITAEYRAYGMGYSSENVLVYGTELWVWDPRYGKWQFLGGNDYASLTASNYSTISAELEKNDYSTSDKIKFIIIPSGASGSLSGYNATLEIDFFVLKSSLGQSVNIGGAVDVYIEDACLQSKSEGFSPDLVNRLTPIADGDAMVWVDKVYFASDPTTILTEGIDYVIAWASNDFKYSSKSNKGIRVANGISADIVIDYYYSPLVNSVQKLVDTDPRVGYKGQDVLIKHMAVSKLSLTGTSTSNSLEEMTILLSEFIKTIDLDSSGDYVLGWSSFYSYLLDNDVISPANIEILSMTRVDGLIESSLIKAAGQQFSLDNKSTFKVEGYFSD